MIELKSVYLQYVSEFYSLYDFSCEINSHTLFVGDFFDGTNSIMRVLSKIDKNYKGDILIDNVNLKDLKDKDLNIVYTPENPVLFQNKNILKNLYYPLKIRKINKNNANNSIKSMIFDLKNANCDFFNNFLLNSSHLSQIKKNSEEKSFNNEIEKFLKLKVKKLSLSEQKILTLLRTFLRKPKYILLENFFENLNENHVSTALYLIEKLKQTSTIIACEKDEITHSLFKDFRIIKLNIANQKKED